MDNNQQNLPSPTIDPEDAIIQTTILWSEVIAGNAISAVDGRVSIYRDYANYAALILGAVITLITVNSRSIIKTTTLMLLGTFLTVIALVMATYFRSRLVRYSQWEVYEQRSHTAKIVSAAIKSKSRLPDGSSELNFLLGQGAPTTKAPGWIIDHGDKLVGGLLFTGFILLAFSLVFKVSL